MDLDWGFPSRALLSLFSAWSSVSITLYKKGYLLMFNVYNFDYTAFAASERTGSCKPLKSLQFIGCKLKCTQTDRPKSARNRCVY